MHQSTVQEDLELICMVWVLSPGAARGRPLIRPPRTVRDTVFRARGGGRGGERGGERLRPRAPPGLWGSCLRHRARNAQAVTVWRVY